LLGAAFGPPAAWAGRPLTTEDTATLAPKTSELEVSVDHTRREGQQTWALHAVVGLGLTSNVEVRIESDVGALVTARGAPDRAGPGDSLVGVKCRFLDETEARPSLLAAVALRLPTGDEDRGLGAPGVDVIALLGIAKTFFETITVTGNLGYAFVTASREQDAWLLGLSLEHRVTSAWTVAGEIFSPIPTRFTGEQVVVRGGASYAVTERLRLDGAVGAGLTRAAPHLLITVGLTWRMF
jgi:hypothetical protein